MIDLQKFEVWFVAGSQELYGQAILHKVAEHSRQIAEGISQSSHIPVRVIDKSVLTSAEAIHQLCQEANQAQNCVGLITWMHTFSPAKMWIAGLRSLQKPFVHLHTQFNRDLPWADIDMDFMNLNQSAHGDREFGFIASRMRLNRKVIVGYWQDDEALHSLGSWMRAACAWQDAQGARIARFGDNMRHVAVTEGDKVEAQTRLGYSVNGYAVGDLARYVNEATNAEVDRLVSEYDDRYRLAESLRPGGSQRGALREAARIELGIKTFLEEGQFKGFTTTFEDLYGLAQMPGLAVQRLMAQDYGFGAEGDWKTAALVRAMKVMGTGLDGGTSFMEDYTYHFSDGQSKVLGAHMLEVCESIAADTISLEIHPLFVGGKSDPPRLVFGVPSGPAINASLIDMGNRFRLIVNEVDVIPPDHPLSKLPVARAVWIPRPNLKTAAAAWILAGGAHHTGFSQAVKVGHLEDFAEIADLEFLVIGKDTEISAWKKELRWNDLYYLIKGGLSPF